MQHFEWLKVIIQLNRSHALLQWRTQVNIIFVLDVYNLFPLKNSKNKWNFKTRFEKSEDIYIFCIPLIKRPNIILVHNCTLMEPKAHPQQNYYPSTWDTPDKSKSSDKLSKFPTSQIKQKSRIKTERDFSITESHSLRNSTKKWIKV